jgi:hypothetical protein
VLATAWEGGSISCDVLAADAVAAGTAGRGLLFGVATCDSVARVGTADWASTVAVEGSTAVAVAVGRAELVGVAAFLVGEAEALGLAFTVGDGVADAVADGVDDGVAVGVADGVDDGVALAEVVGSADGAGVADESDADALGSGVAAAGRTSAMVATVTGWRGCWTAPELQAIAAAAPAVITPNAVRARWLGLRAWPVPALPASTHMNPP